jgi:tetratricopeptide (TPR) repeat protein
LFQIDLGAGDLASALARAKEVSTLHPDRATGDILLGDVHMRQNRFDAAIRAYDAALSKTPGVPLAIKAYQARRAARLDGLAFAVEWVGARVKDPMAQRLLATAYADAGRNREAIAVYESLMKTGSPDAVLLNNLAVLYTKTGDARALEFARRAYESDTGQPAFIDTYGWVLLQQGRANEALTLLRSAKFRAPDVPEIRYHMAAALAALGRTEEALAEIRSALELAESFEGSDEARKLLARLSGSGGGP